MNKRQYKKFVRKYKQKSYYKVRWKKIHKNVLDKYGPEYNLIHIIDSHRMDLKHPIKITTYKNTYANNNILHIAYIDKNKTVVSWLLNNYWKKGVLNESQMESLQENNNT